MIQGKKILCCITARKGSKGIPGKNIRLLAGRPLVQWSMIYSLSSKYVDLTVVSSNCEKVKEATEDLWYWDTGYEMKVYELLELLGDERNPDNHLKFIQRPDEFATDTSPNEDALIHAYHYCKEHFDFLPDYIVNLQPTSPIRSNRMLDRCIEMMDNEGADSLFTASRHTPFFFHNNGSEVIADWDVKKRLPRQQIRQEDFVWHDDGNLYIVKSDLLLKENCRLGGKMICYELGKFEALQIDDEQDFQLIENIMNFSMNGKNQ